MSAYEPFLFEDADEEEAPPDLPKSKDTPAKVTKVAKVETGNSENFSGFSGFSGRRLAFARNPEKRSGQKPGRHDRLCYQCQHFQRSPYGFPLGLCRQHGLPGGLFSDARGNRIQHATSHPAKFGCVSFELRAPDTDVCTVCRHYHPVSTMCRVVNTGCPLPHIPPCTGAHFQPKEARS